MHRRTLLERCFQMWWRLSRGATIGVRIIARAPGGQVALVRHTYVGGLHLPGGGVEKRETAVDAAARELQEETGATPSGPFSLRSVHANHARFPNDHILVFTVDVHAPPDRLPDREIAEVMWVDPNAAPNEVSPSTQRRLAEWVGASKAAPHW